MSDYCVSCGRSVPEGQRVCSMCYGDPDHGRDGYYQAWIEEQQQEYEYQQWLNTINETAEDRMGDK